MAAPNREALHHWRAEVGAEEVRLRPCASRRLAHGARRRRGQACAPSGHRRDRDPLPLRRPTQQRAGDAQQVPPANGAGARKPLRPHARSKKRLDPAAVSRQIGRVFQQNQRAAARFAIALEPDACPAGFSFRSIATPRRRWAALSKGAYLLRSNLRDGATDSFGRLTSNSVRSRRLFGFTKIAEPRPIWHQREDRVQAHILVCFLAFVLWKSLEMWQERAGLGNSPRTILEELARIQSHDVVLPTAAHGEIRLLARTTRGRPAAFSTASA